MCSCRDDTELSRLGDRANKILLPLISTMPYRDMVLRVLDRFPGLRPLLALANAEIDSGWIV